ncbi:hypothetical protein CDD82_1725 [Ophiocordyceps australis]|uniref:Uncharacterized protein n=1 Tax=Ophiocordyceps australis TaxID=1399860 RepID=A0A2C5YBF3_9HYPO|nr:hypothetical protein CDD82_1725 [Ophiocordyceps australis]
MQYPPPGLNPPQNQQPGHYPPQNQQPGHYPPQNQQPGYYPPQQNFNYPAQQPPNGYFAQQQQRPASYAPSGHVQQQPVEYSSPPAYTYAFPINNNTNNSMGGQALGNQNGPAPGFNMQSQTPNNGPFAHSFNAQTPNGPNQNQRPLNAQSQSTAQSHTGVAPGLHMQPQGGNPSPNLAAQTMAQPPVESQTQASTAPGLIHQPQPIHPNTLQSSGQFFASLSHGQDAAASGRGHLGIPRPRAPSNLGGPSMVRSPRGGHGEEQSQPSAENGQSWAQFLNEDAEEEEENGYYHAYTDAKPGEGDQMPPPDQLDGPCDQGESR